LRRIYKDDQVLQLDGQPHALGLVHPGAQSSHHSGHGVLVFLAVEVIEPVAHRHGMLLGDVRQSQRLQQRTDLFADIFVGGLAAFRVAQCG
jgi:hypothetical protein